MATTKVETKPTPAEREAIAPRSLQLDYTTHSRRYWICTLDPSITLDDIGNRPEIWRLCLQDKNKSPGPHDVIELRQSTWTAWAHVSEVDQGRLFLYDIRKANRPSRVTPLFEDDAFKIEMRGSEFAVFRKRDASPLPFGNRLFATVDAARAFIRQQYPVKLGA